MFHDDVDRTAFCRRFTRSIIRYRWTCVAFVLMTTHFHFILEVDDDVLSPGMRDFFGPYAQEFNRRHGRYGHLRAEAFKLRPIRDDVDLRGCAKYIANNPVEAEMVERPQDWEWSSYPGTAGYTRPFPFVNDALLLGSIHDDVFRAQLLWGEIVEETDVKGSIPFTYVA